MLSRYARGEGLLSIHKALRLLYPRNEEMRYSRISRRNATFGNLTPLAVMKEQGIIGGLPG